MTSAESQAPTGPGSAKAEARFSLLRESKFGVYEQLLKGRSFVEIALTAGEISKIVCPWICLYNGNFMFFTVESVPTDLMLRSHKMSFPHQRFPVSMLSQWTHATKGPAAGLAAACFRCYKAILGVAACPELKNLNCGEEMASYQPIRDSFSP